jgi:hypothetical protein
LYDQGIEILWQAGWPGVCRRGPSTRCAAHLHFKMPSAGVIGKGMRELLAIMREK